MERPSAIRICTDEKRNWPAFPILIEFRPSLCSGPMENFDHSAWKKREPWVVIDPDSKREWVCEQPLRYYVVKSADGNWFVCDRWLDVPVIGTKANSREQAIRGFYKWCKRPIPTGDTLPKLPMRIAHQG